jgi:hypothetical protein
MTQTTTDRIPTAGGGSGRQGWAMKRQAWSVWRKVGLRCEA